MNLFVHAAVLRQNGVMPEEVKRYLTAISGTARAVLAGNFVGAYAAGSLSMDAFQVGRSDVDIALCVVIR
jgi:hypothetical protein